MTTNSSLIFILNDQNVYLDDVESNDFGLFNVLLDFIRYRQNLRGTKIGCREGDCGACTVLIGSLSDNKIKYQQVVSCLTPIVNVIGKHIVTIEGLNLKNKLNIVQDYLASAGGTQCGACTPGFIVSISAYMLNQNYDENIINYIDGNICRCTGYQSIIQACNKIKENLIELTKTSKVSLEGLSRTKLIPPYFENITNRLKLLDTALIENKLDTGVMPLFLGGGTDLYVQQFEKMENSNSTLPMNQPFGSSTIISHDNRISIGSSATVSQIMESKILTSQIEDHEKFFKLFASSHIRNMATLGGNIANASPIADMVIYFLAFDPIIVIETLQGDKTLQLREFYLDYKILDKKPDEKIKSIEFNTLPNNAYFNFEKVSKRTHLDIASVNSALLIVLDENKIITRASITAGGIAPIPKYLSEMSEFLIGKSISTQVLINLLSLLESEISPIDDIRGSSDYKRLLLRQLIIAHFMKLFPEDIDYMEVLR